MRFMVWILLAVIVLGISFWLVWEGSQKFFSDSMGVDRYYQQGLRALYRHEFVDAEKLFLKCTQLNKDEAELWLALGIAQLNQAAEGVARAKYSLSQARHRGIDDPRPFFCLGHVHMYLEQPGFALTEFREALERAPDNADAHYQMARTLVALDRADAALPHFEAAAERDPLLSGAWYQLARQYHRLGRRDESQRAQQKHQQLKKSGRAHERGLVFTELGSLSEPDRGWRSPQAQAAKSGRDLSFSAAVALDQIQFPLAIVQDKLESKPELWSPSGAHSLVGELEFLRAIPELTPARSFAVSDFTEDGLLDLVVAHEDAVYSYRQEAAGYQLEQSFVGLLRPAVHLIDLDLEGDLDLLVTSPYDEPRIAVNARAELDADKTFKALSESPLTKVDSQSHLLLARDLNDDGDPELLFGTSSRTLWIDNGPQWAFEMAPPGEKLFIEILASAMVAVDLDGDGADELLVVGESGSGIYWHGAYNMAPQHSEFFSEASCLGVADFNLDGLPDIVLPGKEQSRLYINLGGQRFARAEVELPTGSGLATGDVDGDGDPDLLIDGKDQVWLVRNSLWSLESPARVFKLTLGGVRDSDDRRSNLRGMGARVEIYHGGRRQSRVVDGGNSQGAGGRSAQGVRPQVFGLGEGEQVDLVIIKWTDGVIQAEGPFAAGSEQKIEQVQRKSSSCPILFTWDGEQYRFITDFMGGGGLGFWLATDEYAKPDASEVVLIPGEALQEIDGELRLSVMEPMQELCYIDQLALTAYSYPSGFDLYPREYFAASGESADGRALLVDRSARIFPTRATAANGQDCTAELLKVDRHYAEPLQPHPMRMGYCQPHEVVLEFATLPVTDTATLFLHGWVEYPYSRLNFAANQSGQALSPPSFYYRVQADGEWQLLHQEFGYPAGMPKTMVVPIAQAAAAGATQLKIETNMEIFWDQIFVATAQPAPVGQSVSLNSALLRFGGYPREYSDDGQLPPTYHYHERGAHLPYARAQGYLTEHGEVNTLLQQADDQFVIIGGGDELWLRFAAPELDSSQSQSYLLTTVGYCKDLDPLTAERQNVSPLPQSTMSNYPPQKPISEPKSTRSAQQRFGQ